MPRGRTEELVEWYLRLNGYFIIPNYILHPLMPCGSQRTEIDLLGVRFPYQSEVVCNSEGKRLPMENDAKLIDNQFVDCLIVSVKGAESEAEVNRKIKDFQNLKDVIKRFGFVESEDEIVDVAKELLREKKAVRGQFQIRFLGIAGKYNRYSKTKQIILKEIVEFILMRFRAYYGHKADTEQWTGIGKEMLKNCFMVPEEFLKSIELRKGEDVSDDVEQL
jgi:hypothetical protein